MVKVNTFFQTLSLSSTLKVNKRQFHSREASERTHLVLYVHFQVPFLGPDSQLASSVGRTTSIPI